MILPPLLPQLKGVVRNVENWIMPYSLSCNSKVDGLCFGIPQHRLLGLDLLDSLKRFWFLLWQDLFGMIVL
jgi:hypothetical protein